MVNIKSTFRCSCINNRCFWFFSSQHMFFSTNKKSNWSIKFCMQVPDNDLEEPHTQFHCKICCGANRVFLCFQEMMGLQLMEEQTNPDHTKFMKKNIHTARGGATVGFVQIFWKGQWKENGAIGWWTKESFFLCVDGRIDARHARHFLQSVFDLTLSYDC